MTGDLVERLRSALDEAEKIARAAMVWRIGREHDLKIADGCWKTDGCYVEGDGITIYDEGGHTVEQAAHIAANDPAHVLRTIESHRRVIEAYETAVVSRNAAVDTPLAGATRMALRIRAEHLDWVAAIYLPDIETGDTPK